MVFTKQDIPAKILYIIDIGSYKLRVCAASFKNKNITLLGYHEKRQDVSYFSNQECTNLPGLCTNIADVIEKLEKETHTPCEDIVINYPFGEIFFASKTLHFPRKHPTSPIDEAEIETLLENTQKHCLKQLSDEIEETYGLSQREIQILLSRIHTLSLDGQVEEKILHKTAGRISLGVVNAFIPINKHHTLTQIGNVLKKKMYRVIPTEYSIAKIFSQENIVIINVGANQTSITLKKDSEVFALSKISIGINDLVNKIARKHDFPRAEIIEKLSGNYFGEEKSEFLEIWGESIGISLQDMLGSEICPHVFYIGGGGGVNNTFLQSHIENFPFFSYNIRILKQAQCIKQDLTSLYALIKNITVQDIEKISLDMFVLLYETHTLLSHESDIISLALKRAIEKLGYIKS